jgi:hypothetical protein
MYSQERRDASPEESDPRLEIVGRTRSRAIFDLRKGPRYSQEHQIGLAQPVDPGRLVSAHAATYDRP